MLVDLSKSMVRSKEILVTAMKTIYNARYIYKVNERGGGSQMQQLLGKLAEHNYIEWHKNCENNKTVTDLI